MRPRLSRLGPTPGAGVLGEPALRHLIRLVAPVLATIALVLAGSTSALASTSPTSVPLDAQFCFQSGARTTCYDIDGTLRYLDTAAGSSATVNKTTVTTAWENGVVVGEARSTSFSRTVFEADGTFVVQSVVNTRSSLGDEPCEYRMVMRLVDLEAVVYEVTQTCS